MTTNRITEYFDEHDPRREVYAEVCDAGWQGMVNHTIELWFGNCEVLGVEDFLFRNANHN